MVMLPWHEEEELQRLLRDPRYWNYQVPHVVDRVRELIKKKFRFEIMENTE